MQTISIGPSFWYYYPAVDLITGLSGVESLPPNTGMLFDLRSDTQVIGINMDYMLFPLDIVFINSSGVVSGVLHNVQPGDQNVVFDASQGLSARYFLEVNAGEAEGVSIGDVVGGDFVAYPPASNPVTTFMTMIVPIMMIGMIIRAAR